MLLTVCVALFICWGYICHCVHGEVKGNSQKSILFLNLGWSSGVMGRLTWVIMISGSCLNKTAETFNCQGCSFLEDAPFSLCTLNLWTFSQCLLIWHLKFLFLNNLTQLTWLTAWEQEHIFPCHSICMCLEIWLSDCMYVCTWHWLSWSYRRL